MFLEILFLGRGGQGVVTAGRIVAEAALRAGLFSQSFPEFGPERSGAPVRSYVRISDEPISMRAPMESFDVAVVFEERLLDSAIVESVRSGGTVVLAAESARELPRGDVKLFVVGARRIIEELKKPRSLNLAMVGALCSVINVIPLKHVEDIVGRRFGEENREVVRRAAQLVVSVEQTA
jgi:pyruvate ferredoxin oxidoreductase gamma subunit